MRDDRAVALALAAAGDADLDSTGAAIHRNVASAHVELPAAGVMARVESIDRLSIAHRQVEAARFLETRAFRAARLMKADRQPLVYSDGVVTLWKAVCILERQPDPAALGRFARDFHAASSGELPAEIPDFDPFPPIRAWLDRPGPGPPPEGIRELQHELDQVIRSWDDAIAEDPLGTVLVHGDFQKDNVVLTPQGLTLLDFEDAGRGPASWDFVPQIVGERRYGAPRGTCRAFCDAYGADPMAWEGTEYFCRVFELSSISWAVAHRHTSPAMAAEAELRLSTFLGGTGRSWTLL